MLIGPQSSTTAGTVGGKGAGLGMRCVGVIPAADTGVLEGVTKHAQRLNVRRFVVRPVLVEVVPPCSRLLVPELRGIPLVASVRDSATPS